MSQLAVFPRRPSWQTATNRRQMHRIWYIPELLSSVLIHLDKSDLVKIARTCRGFWAPAVALIWETLYRLAFKCWTSPIGPEPDVSSLTRFLSRVENLKGFTFTVNDLDIPRGLLNEGSFILQFVSLVQSSQLETLRMESSPIITPKREETANLKPCERFQHLTTFTVDFELVSISMDLTISGLCSNVHGLKSLSCTCLNTLALNGIT
ncbi:hypothetical protein FRB99_004366 [Tulasnella sp. 403]|nr:hypothetical protein FRB99_004366 [Tulasnella sp. 403]